MLSSQSCPFLPSTCSKGRWWTSVVKITWVNNNCLTRHNCQREAKQRSKEIQASRENQLHCCYVQVATCAHMEYVTLHRNILQITTLKKIKRIWSKYALLLKVNQELSKNKAIILLTSFNSVVKHANYVLTLYNLPNFLFIVFCWNG